MAYLNRRGIESKPTDHTMIQPLNNSLKSSLDGNRNEMTGNRFQSISNTSNSISTNNGSIYLKMDQTNSTIGSEENSITIHDKTDQSSLSKPDSIHSTLVFSDHCYSLKIVSIKSWTLLERLVIGDHCCSKTKSFEICHCPKLKSIKVGKFSFSNSLSCFIFGIEL